jgi:plastocyanin
MAINFPSNPVNGQTFIALGRGWQYNSSATAWEAMIRVNTAFDSDDIPEGTTNLYQNPENIQDEVNNLLVAGTNITLTYNDVANSLTIDSAGGGGGGATALEDLTNVSSTSPNTGQVLKWAGTEWAPAADATGGGGSGIALTDLSVGAEGTASGDGDVSYNNVTGVFTYTPPDTSSFLTTIPAQTFASLTGKPTTIAGYGITDAFDGAYNSLTGKPTLFNGQFNSLTGKPTTISGYGITDSYTDSDVDTHLNTGSAGSNQVLSWTGSDYDWVQSSGMSDLVEDTTPQLGGNLDTNGNNIAFGDSATPGTDDTLKFGAGSDMSIYHDSSVNKNVIKSLRDLNLELATGETFQLIDTASEVLMQAGVTGKDVLLFCDNVQRLATTTTGVTITGNLNATIQHTFNISASGSSAYVFVDAGQVYFPTTVNNPDLYLKRGDVYKFSLNASGHPFYIKSVAGTGTGNQYNIGVTGNGAQTGEIIFKVAMSAPDTLYYQCSAHSGMVGTINIIGAGGGGGGGSTGDISFSGSTISSSGTTITLDDDVTVSGTLTSSQAGSPILTSASSITLRADASSRVHVDQSPLRLYNVSTTNRNSITAADGDMIYNTTTNKAQVFANGSWVDLH